MTGLLALVLLHAGRRDARTDDAGLPVLLDGQDERRWDAAVLDEGVRRRLLRSPPPPRPVRAAGRDRRGAPAPAGA